jgi:hypothetical protein
MKALYSHAILAGGAATLEPHGLSPAGRLRPDMQILFPGQHILTDVVISHPLCPSHIAQASTGSCRVADKEAFKKSDKYAEVTQYQEGARFVPFAIETTGGMGKDARALVEQISLACRDHLTLQTHASIARGLRAAIAIAVQRGNGLAMQAFLLTAVWRRSASVSQSTCTIKLLPIHMYKQTSPNSITPFYSLAFNDCIRPASITLAFPR